MEMKRYIVKGIVCAAIVVGATTASAVSVNNWRGDAEGAEWSDPYKWKLKHVPTDNESVHFRGENSVITVNATVNLNNGMHLYGEELSLQGNGNINMWSQIPHARTVNIPASATGYANLTLSDNLSLNGRIALSAKGFGTSASKGSVTLKDRSNVTGVLSVGNAGNGTGQVYVKGNSTYRITGLELDTKADSGGSAEIHVLGGTVRMETKENPFDTFLEDPSRKIVLGDAGTLRIEHDLSISRKKDAIKSMIQQDRLVAAPGCRLTTPVIQDKMLIIQAEDERNESTIKSKNDLIAAINRIPNSSSIAKANAAQPKKLESLLNNMRTGNTPKPVAQPAVAKSQPVIPKMMQQAATVTPEPQKQDANKLAGYIVFIGSALLVLRRAKNQEEEK